MGYSIRYGTSWYDAKTVDKKRRKIIVSASVLCAVILLCTLFSDQISSLRQHILPFLEPEVQDAFAEMASKIGEGTTFKDAATAFCREILIEAAG